MGGRESGGGEDFWALDGARKALEGGTYPLELHRGRRRNQMQLDSWRLR